MASIVSKQPDTSMFAIALANNNLNDLLMTDGEYTFFAPSNQALMAMTTADRSALLDNSDALKAYVQHNLVHQVETTYQFAVDSPLTAVDGSQLTLAAPSGGGYTVDGSKVTDANIQGTNGYVQVVDGVIQP